MLFNVRSVEVTLVRRQVDRWKVETTLALAAVGASAESLARYRNALQRRRIQHVDRRCYIRITKLHQQQHATNCGARDGQ